MYPKRHVSPFLLFFFLFLFRTAHAYGIRLPEISIEPVDQVEFSYGRSIPVQVRITDTDSTPTVRCYFRYKPRSELFFVELKTGNDGLYHGLLPAPAATVNTMEFRYVVVNSSHQIVRSRLYSADPENGRRRKAPAGTGGAVIRVWAELPAAVKSGLSFFDPAEVKIELAAQQKRFGFAAGLYTQDDLAGINAGEGYFGGFALQEDGRLMPVKGVMLDPLSIIAPDAAGHPLPTTSASILPTTRASTDLVGPDIAGEGWHGFCYYGWGESLGLLLAADVTPITALVTHDGTAVSITLSTVCNIYGELIGPDLEGSMNESGDILVDDHRNPPQTWSSHWGPATATKILIGDYVTLPTLEDPYADYYVIELERDPPPLVSFLPEVYELLLNSP